MSLIAKQLLIHNIGLPTEISMLVKDYTFPRINKIPKNDKRYRMFRNTILRYLIIRTNIQHSLSILINFIMPDGIDINNINHIVCLTCPRSEESAFFLIYTDLAIIMIKLQFINSRDSKDVIAMHIKN